MDAPEEQEEGMGPFEYKCIAIWGGGEKTARILKEYGR